MLAVRGARLWRGGGTAVISPALVIIDAGRVIGPVRYVRHRRPGMIGGRSGYATDLEWSMELPECGMASVPCSAKGQELMARHTIDEAVLDAGRTGGPGGVVGWRIGVDDPIPPPRLVPRGDAADGQT